MDKNIVEFLLRAKRATYAGDGHESASSRPASRDLRYEEGALLYIDSYLGGEKFAGEEALWKDGKPIWAMNYAGRILGEGFSRDFHLSALRLGTTELPFRGPPRHDEGAYSYECAVEGDASWFSGREEIRFKGARIYECVFHGGEIV